MSKSQISRRLLKVRPSDARDAAMRKVIRQIPPEYVLRLAEDLKNSMNEGSGWTG